MKLVLLTQLIFTVLGGYLMALIGTAQQGFSFAAGSLLILLSFFLLGLGFSLIFRKKLIALAIAIIVFKYAILGIIIFKIVKLAWFDPLGFALGIASFVLSGLLYAWRQA